MPGPFAYRRRVRMGPQPAPVCDVAVIGPSNRLSLEALIDSGSSFTKVPYTVITALTLRRQGERRVRHADGTSEETEFYIASVNFNGIIYDNHPLYRWDEDFALIGRDILNRHVVNMDGPTQQLTVTP